MADNPVHRGNTKTLDSLLMQTGPLDKLLTDHATWTGIAAKLKSVFLTYIQKELTPEEQAEYVAELCTVYYPYRQNRIIKDQDDAEHTDQVKATVDFLEKFMKSNGQWDYIEAQPWFTSGKYLIAIDVNYYPDRSGYKTSPIFHKDTGGNNIFVNLIFDNEKDIEATEWFADLAKPTDKRLRWQTPLLPPSHLTELDFARKTLAETHGKDKEVSGGVARGKNIYVSWVDDLVWHATPSANRRVELSAEAAQRCYAGLNKSVNGRFDCADGTLKATILGAEVLGTMAECPSTRLSKWLATEGLTAQDVNLEVGRKAWKTLYQSDEAQFRGDAVERAKTPWRITGEYSIAIDKDPRLPGTTLMKETPASLSERRRANSVDENRQEIEKVRKENEGVPRAFLRTWVRIVRRDSDEVKKAGLALQ